MHRRFYELAVDHAKSPRLRELMSKMLTRCDEFEKLEGRLNDIAAARRSVREGISREQIGRQIKRVVAEYGPRPDELQRFDADMKKFLLGAADIDLFRMMRDEVSEEYEDAVGWLNWKKLPADIKPLYQQRADFHSETRRMLEDFARAEAMPLP